MWDHLNDFPLGIISQILGARVHPETLLSGEYPDAMAVRMHFQMIFRLFFFWQLPYVTLFRQMHHYSWYYYSNSDILVWLDLYYNLRVIYNLQNIITVKIVHVKTSEK